ncbi:MAG: PQQ-dependent sugar dehydrogenase [Flavobacteriales bacterium]|nr:PQQ-dependent sugar dehydrogenase [Flavobacteriales bacterium]
MRRSILTAAIVAPLMLSAQVLNKPKVALRNWATGLSEPVGITNCGDSRMFVIERAGRIKIISDSMTVLPTPFLNISGPVQSAGGEQGLLGLAFEPNYLDSGYFYVYYIAGTGNGTSRISRFSVSSDPDLADVASEQVLWEWPQPYSNHNGGDLHFGPDGYLYLSLGDGGSGDDPEGNGQDYLEPLGGMICIDVSAHDTTYLIPPSNPFSYETGTDTLPEIWATGLRNPYRWSFDRLTGNMWIGDVGQNAWEEVDFWAAGNNTCPNFGWRCREGLVANNNVSQSNCLGAAGYVSPVAVFENVGTGGQYCSMMGGYVYRGSWYPHHYGHYIFTDYCAGDFLTFSDETNTDVDTMLATTTVGYAGFGEDLDGQLYVVDQSNDLVKKIFDPCPMADPVITSDDLLFTATSGNSYQWLLNGVLIPGANQQTFSPTVNGNYQVRVNFGTPCNLISDTLVYLSSSIEELAPVSLRIYPQPGTDVVTIEGYRSAISTELKLIDAMGRVVSTVRLAKGQNQITFDVAQLPAGTYLLREVAADGSYVSAAALVVAH